jgi:hypothetical protein
MIVKLVSTSMWRDKCLGNWEIRLDNGRVLEFEVESEHCHVEYDGPDETIKVGKIKIKAEKLLDLVFASGEVTEDSDEFTVTPEWLAEQIAQYGPL